MPAGMKSPAEAGCGGEDLRAVETLAPSVVPELKMHVRDSGRRVAKVSFSRLGSQLPGPIVVNAIVVCARPVNLPAASLTRLLLPVTVTVLATNAAVTADAVLPVKLKAAALK